MLQKQKIKKDFLILFLKQTSSSYRKLQLFCIYLKSLKWLKCLKSTPALLNIWQISSCSFGNKFEVASKSRTFHLPSPLEFIFNLDSFVFFCLLEKEVFSMYFFWGPMMEKNVYFTLLRSNLCSALLALERLAALLTKILLVCRLSS